MTWGWVRRAGRVAAMPVTLPVKLVRKGKERAMTAVIAGVVRHLLTAAGGAAILSGDEMNQAAGAIATLIGLAWSVIPKIVAARNATA